MHAWAGQKGSSPKSLALSAKGWARAWECYDDIWPPHPPVSWAATVILIGAFGPPLFLLGLGSRHFKGLLAGIIRRSALLQSVLAGTQGLAGVECDWGRMPQRAAPGMRVVRSQDFGDIRKAHDGHEELYRVAAAEVLSPFPGAHAAQHSLVVERQQEGLLVKMITPACPSSPSRAAAGIRLRIIWPWPRS